MTEIFNFLDFGKRKNKQELQIVLKFPIEIFLNLVKLDEVGLKNAQIYIDPSSHYEILCSSNFFVEHHLDVILEVLQVVGSKFLFHETCRYLP